jgi:hypothetical protein
MVRYTEYTVSTAKMMAPTSPLALAPDPAFGSSRIVPSPTPEATHTVVAKIPQRA